MEISVIQGNVLVDKFFEECWVFVYICVRWIKNLVPKCTLPELLYMCMWESTVLY